MTNLYLATKLIGAIHFKLYSTKGEDPGFHPHNAFICTTLFGVYIIFGRLMKILSFKISLLILKMYYLTVTLTNLG